MYSPRGGGHQGGPGPNALAAPQGVPAYQPPMLSSNALAAPAAPPMGSGLMKWAIDAKTQYPIWQQLYIEGKTNQQFPDWLKEQMGQNPIMPRQNQQAPQASQGYAPRGY
jgi:hypothetical protein